ncbi:MAG: parallel beta-helix domain-containing protein [Myxococcota bacterium]
MKKSFFLGLAALTGLAALSGCGDDGDDGGVDGTPSAFTNRSCADVTGNCIEIADAATLIEEVNLLDADTVLVLGAGTFEFDNAVTIRQSGISLVGQGIDTTTLSFGTGTTQFNGVDVVGDDFLVEDLTVLDAPKDGIRVEDSDGVTFRRIRTTWTNAGDMNNGAYGIYPVKSQNVLVEDSFAENASDAGLYVGQCINVIVRNNEVRGNVAGLEIENTQYADVYNNLAEDNTGGIVVFDLPGNPIVGRDVRLRDNIIINNNRENFAPGGTVGQIPAGTGTFAMASRRVEITNNRYENNGTVDIALISGLVIEGDTSAWDLQESELIGDYEDLALLPGTTAGALSNHRSENIMVAGNTHMGSGNNPDRSRELGGLIFFLYVENPPVDNVVYDNIGESAFDAEDLAANSNDNHLCVGGNTNGTLGLLNLENAPAPILAGVAAPFGPFDCDALDGGAVGDVTLPQLAP